jgi:acyl-CoA thioester hydrolase
VLYADTDAMGVVYHATFFRWFETGRAEYMRRRGVPYSEVEKNGIGLPVVEAHAVYLKPARYDDLLEINTWIGDLGRAQVRIEYAICRDGVELVRGFTRHAAVDRRGRPTRLPPKVREALQGPQIGETQGGRR